MSLESTHAAYEQALEGAFNAFKLHFTSNSPRWRALSSTNANSAAPTTNTNNKGKSKELLNGLGTIDQTNVVVHSKGAQGGLVLRAVAEVPCAEGATLDDWRAVLESDETRSSWNSLVEHAHTVEILDVRTRISKTDYRLGWPASPRDTVTLSRTFSDPATLIILSTSVPRSRDDPHFLRPAPPYVRSQVPLLAWCIQVLPAVHSTPPRIKMTLFWHWSLKLVTAQSLGSLFVSLVDFVRNRGSLIPVLSGYGRCLTVASTSFDQSAETFEVEYSILPEDVVEKQKESAQKTLDQLEQSKTSKRLERKIELRLSASQGWDAQVDVKPQSGAESSWTGALETGPGSETLQRNTLRLSHAALTSPDQLVRIKLVVTRLAGGKGVRLDGRPLEAAKIEPRDPTPKVSLEKDDDGKSGTTSESGFESISSARNEREKRSQNAVDALLRRNYIYFTSLLQEPEAKWRQSMDSSGVTVTQLNSIDPTLTIYRAEATFVGIGVWDVFATIVNPNTRKFWDRYYEEAKLLDDAGEAKLWWEKMVGRWPVAPRDSVTLRTAYKSPTAVHVFSFSTDDTALFPSIPPVESPTIRTQTSLYGWAIEALNPSTTQITLIDQTDPKGWSNKAWTPATMIAAVSGVGDYALKHGGPPMVTRMSHCKMTLSEYDHDKSQARVEYRATVQGEGLIECEIRCDNNTWCHSLDLVVDPPPKSVTALSRHRLSSGGGMWLTVVHDALALSEDRIVMTVRKGPSARERGNVVVNGSKVKVDTEYLPEDEIKMLNQRKRIKASPIPLDQYPTHGPRLWKSTHKNSPLGTPVANVTEDPMSAITSVADAVPNGETSTFSKSMTPQSNKPAARALEALAWLQTFHAEQGPELNDPAPGWTIVTERTGTVVRKKLIPAISETLPVYRGDRIVQGLTAEEIKSIVSATGCRQSWDERIESAISLASFGRGVTTSVLTTRPAFPFKGRLFHLATINAQTTVPSASASTSTSTVCFVASASFVPQEEYDPALVNPSSLLPARILLEGWILETLDPYTSSMLAIPSTRCTYVTCVDHSGSVPFALNSVLNANLAKLIGTVETLGKAKGPLPRVLTPDVVLQIEGALNDDNEETVWRLKPSHSRSTFIQSDYDVKNNVFEALFACETKKSTDNEHTIKSTATKQGETALIKGEIPRSASQAFGPASSALKKQPSRPELARKPSSGSLLTPLPNATTGSKVDLTIAEIVIDLKQFPAGYSIKCVALDLEGRERPFSLDPLPAPIKVPVRAYAFSAPLPSILSASLDSWKRSNHLVRLFIPLADIEAPIRDPLRDQKPAPPAWYERFKKHGALFRVTVTANPAGSTTDEPLVQFNEQKLDLQAIKDHRGTLARMEDEDDWHSSGAKISRTLRKARNKSDEPTEKASSLPPDLASPIAVAKRMLALPKTILSASDGRGRNDSFPDPKSPGVLTPNNDGARSPHLSNKGGGSPSVSRRDTARSEPGGRPLLSMIRANTLSRIGSSMTVRQEKEYTARFVLVVALVSFLVGSLLRSLLTPADYIIYRPLEEQGSNVERMVMQAFDPHRRWREARRLLELRGYGVGWDLIVAVVKRD